MIAPFLPTEMFQTDIDTNICNYWKALQLISYKARWLGLSRILHLEEHKYPPPLFLIFVFF